MISNQSGWSLIGGSALGGRHVSTGAPNQDAWVTETMFQGGKNYVVMAVADGHGGSRYVRSDVGSKLAVAVAVEVVRDALETGLFDGPTRKVDKGLAAMPAQLVASWSLRCLDHLSDNPFTEKEADAARAPLQDDPLLSYGSTLLVAILSPNRCCLLQLGDGDSLVAGADGAVVQPLPPDDRLTGGETTSLCLPNADRDFRLAMVEQPAPTLVLLSTDGYGIAFADPGWRQAVTTDLLHQLRTRGAERVAESLPVWLAESARVGGDDATVALAYRPQAKTRPKSPAESRVGRIVTLAGFALLVGAAAGWMAANGLMGSVRTSATTNTVAATTSSAGPTTTSGEPTTTSAGPENTRTEGGDVGAGSGVSQGGPRAGMVGGGGLAVEFYADLADPDASIVAAPLVTETSLSAFAWGAFWSIEEGRLLADGKEVEVVLEPQLTFVGVEFENDLLWLLSEDFEWLIAYDPDSICRVFPIDPTEGAQAGGPDGIELDLIEPACADPAGVGE